MKFISTLLLLICLVFVSNRAYSQKKGQVEGFVQDVQSGEKLPYATIAFEGSTIGTVSDDKGYFKTPAVKAGSYKLKISFIGYQDTLINVEVIENKTIQQNVQLTFGKQLGEVVITAQAFGQVKAINTQLTALAIKNVVSDVKIRELPDANAAEALARLPGVSVERSGGEAIDIRVRGLSDNTYYVNGMPMAGGLASISPYMIGSIELSKAFLPDQDANVRGGAIDFKMREAPSGFKKDITFRTGYNDFTKSFKMQDFSALFSDRFFGDKLGIMLSLSYDRKNRGRDQLSAQYDQIRSSAVGLGSNDVIPIKLTDVSLSHTETLNNRYGVTMFTDYKLNNGKLYYQGFLSSLQSDNDVGINDYSNSAQITYSSQSFTTTTNGIMNGIGGEHVIFGVHIDWGVSYSHTVISTPDKYSYGAFNLTGMAPGTANKIDSSTTIPQYLALGTNNLAGTDCGAMYKLKNTQNNNDLVYKINFQVPFTISRQINGFVKFGAKAQQADNDNTTYQKEMGLNHDTYGNQMIRTYMVNRTPEINWTMSPNGLDYAHSSVTGSQEVQDFSMLGAKTYYFPNFNKIKYIINNMYDLMGHVASTDAENYTNNEQIYAGYVMSVINVGQMITLIPGVRYEYDKFSTMGRTWKQNTTDYYAPDAQQGNLGDTTNGSYNRRFFPMFHLKFKPVSWFDMRFSYTNTLTRPDLTSRSPSTYQDISYNLTVGNPFLLPEKNTNYDLYFSFYGNEIGLFTAGLFYKELEDQVFQYNIHIIKPADYGLAAPYANKIYSIWINNKWPGYIKGLELDWQTQFSYLPGLLKGIILNANLTFMQSNTKYPFYSFNTISLPKPPFRKSIGVDSLRADKITGMPDMVGNISLGYEIGGFSGRISAYYQSNTLTGVTAQKKSIDLSNGEYLRLDLQLSYKLKKIPGLMVYFNAENLTNYPDMKFETYYPNKTQYEEKYGISADIGVRYKF